MRRKRAGVRVIWLDIFLILWIQLRVFFPLCVSPHWVYLSGHGDKLQCGSCAYSRSCNVERQAPAETGGKRAPCREAVKSCGMESSEGSWVMALKMLR